MLCEKVSCGKLKTIAPCSRKNPSGGENATIARAPRNNVPYPNHRSTAVKYPTVADFIAYRSVIDDLPKQQQNKVIDAILAGKSLREIAKIAGTSAPAVQRYKQHRVTAALELAKQTVAESRIKKAAKLPSNQPDSPVTLQQPIPVTASVTVDETTKVVDITPTNDAIREVYDTRLQEAIVTKNLVRSSPVRERLESLYSRTERSLDKAEALPTVDGMAPLLNTAVKQVELLAKLTGELTEQQQGGLTIQIMIPGASPAAAPVAMQQDQQGCFEAVEDDDDGFTVKLPAR